MSAAIKVAELAVCSSWAPGALLAAGDGL